MENQNAIIVDIDGTYALGIGEHREAFEYHKCGHDKQNKTVKMVMVAMIRSHYIDKIIFLSGRENVSFPGKSERKDKCFRVGKFQGIEYPDCKTLTHAWLEYYLQHFDDINENNNDWGPYGDWNLTMRAANDYRKDDEVKYDMYDYGVKDRYKVHYVLDDRNQVVDMWRNKCGLTCFQVAPGDF